MESILKYLLSFTLLFCSLFAKDDMSKKTIKFTGEVKEHIKKRVSIKEIEKLGLQTYNVLDPYTKKKTNYSGVDLKVFANYFGKNSVKNIDFKALDGYQITITKKEWEKYNILLVTRIENKIVGYDKKGPLRIVFPKYQVADENFAKNLPKWIWMIKSIKFK